VPSSLDEVLTHELRRLDAAGLRRELKPWRGPQGPWIELAGQRLSSFSSNNYLGLAGHPALGRAAATMLDEAGVGAAASRLIAGNHTVHQALEEDLARFHRAPAALLFNSGFQANVGVIPALVGQGDLILSDQLNHASLIDGCRLSRAHVQVYDHADPDRVQALLANHRRAHRHCLIATESVFSMDGDRAPLCELAHLAREHRAWLLVDEAHAVGTLGPDGRGLCAELDLQPDILIGTLGKAFGSFGAYVAGSSPLRSFLLHRARSFVFTTALPPAVAAASRAALAIAAGPDGHLLRRDLLAHIDRFRTGLLALDLLAPGAGSTPIFPIWVGDDNQSLTISRQLLDAGIHAQAIRPPTVPRGTARLRFALIATHKPHQLDHALDQLAHLRHTGYLGPAKTS